MTMTTEAKREELKRAAEKAARKALAEILGKAMPRVADMVAGHRQRMGDAHVTDCIRRGLNGEPGQFFAREGTLAVGTPWAADEPLLRLFELQPQYGGGAFVMLREPAGDLPARPEASAEAGAIASSSTGRA